MLGLGYVFLEESGKTGARVRNQAGQVLSLQSSSSKYLREMCQCIFVSFSLRSCMCVVVVW